MLEAENQGLFIRRVYSTGDLNGKTVPKFGTIEVSLSDLYLLTLVSGLAKTEMKIRIEYAHDATDCSMKQRAVLATEWEPVP